MNFMSIFLIYIYLVISDLIKYNYEKKYFSA